MWPRRQCAEQQQDQNHKQNCTEHANLLLLEMTRDDGRDEGPGHQDGDKSSRRHSTHAKNIAGPSQMANKTATTIQQSV